MVREENGDSYLWEIGMDIWSDKYFIGFDASWTTIGRTS